MTYHARKLLFIMPNMGGGGAERILTHVLRYLDPNQFDVHLFLRSKRGVHVARIPRHIKVLTHGSLLKRMYARPCLDWLPRWLLLRNGYHTVVAFLEYSAEHLAQLCRDEPGIKKVVWVHNDKDCYRWLPALQQADVLVCVSHAVAQALLAAGTPPLIEKLRVLYNPTEIAHIRSSSQCAQALFDPRYCNVLAVGSLVHSKRYDRLIDAARILRDKGTSHFRVHILGTGALHETIVAQLARHHLQDVCVLHGWQDNPAAYMAQADIVVHTSDHEGFPGVIAEARVLCKPIVTTGVAGVQELLEDGRLGIVVRKNDATHIAHALAALIASPTQRAEMAQLLANTAFPFAPAQTMPAIARLLAQD